MRRSLLSLALALALPGLVAACGQRDAPVAAGDVPTSRPSSNLEDALQRARDALQRGDHAHAIGLSRAIVDEHPSELEARVILASAYQLAGRPDDALRQANLALSIDPGPVGSWLTKAAALAALGETDLAIDATNKALERDADHPGALRNLAALYGNRRAWKAQGEVLAKLADLDEADLDARMAVARNWLARDNVPAAEAVAKEVVALDPRHVDAQLLLGAAAWDRADYRATLDRARYILAVDEAHEAATTLLEGAFYVLVAAELRCAHGERPWSEADVAVVLADYDKLGLSGVGAFFDLDERLAQAPDVQTRVQRAARARCPRAPSDPE